MNNKSKSINLIFHTIIHIYTKLFLRTDNKKENIIYDLKIIAKFQLFFIQINLKLTVLKNIETFYNPYILINKSFFILFIIVIIESSFISTRNVNKIVINNKHHKI